MHSLISRPFLSFTLAVSLGLALFQGCATVSKVSGPQEGDYVQVSGGESPEWVDNAKSTAEFKVFVGLSRRHAAEADAPTAARRSAQVEAVNSMGTYVKQKVKEALGSEGSTEDILSAAVIEQTGTKMVAEGIITGEVDKWYVTQWKKFENGQWRPYYEAKCLFKMPREDASKLAQEAIKQAGLKAKEERDRKNLKQAQEVLDGMDAQDW